MGLALDRCHARGRGWRGSGRGRHLLVCLDGRGISSEVEQFLYFCFIVQCKRVSRPDRVGPVCPQQSDRWIRVRRLQSVVPSFISGSLPCIQDRPLKRSNSRTCSGRHTDSRSNSATGEGKRVLSTAVTLSADHNIDIYVVKGYLC